MSENRKRLRAELQREFADLADFGVTEEEIEALMEQCGFPPRRSRLFNTGCKKNLTAANAEKRGG